MTLTRKNWPALVIKPLFAAVAVLLLYLALTGLNWHAFIAALIAMHPAWVIGCLIFEFGGLMARAYRWNLLLSHQAGRCLFISFVGEAIGDLGNTFLPARAGEAMRTVVVARKLRVGIAFVAGSAVTERVSDAVFLAFTALLMLIFIPKVPVWLTSAAGIFFILGVLVLLAIWFLPRFNRAILPLLHKLSVPAAISNRLEQVLSGIWLGAQALLGHPWRALIYAFMTLVIWLLDGIALICLARAFGDHLSVAQAMLFLAALGLSSAIPSTPGYIGIFQFVAVAVLVPFGINQSHAIAIILVFQITTILLELCLGGAGWLWLTNNRMPRLWRTKTH